MGLHFSKEEFSNRKEKTLNSMKNEGVDALIMFRQESMYWLTGYDTFGYVFFQALVLDQKGNVILLTRAPDQGKLKTRQISVILEFGLIKMVLILLMILK